MNPIVKNVLFIGLGMVLMFVILKALSSKTVSTSNTSKDIKAILFSQKFANLARTNEFRELAKMPEFTELLKGLASDQLKTIAQAMFV